ncbi:MAG: hypothetical protein UT22_C0009G0008 [Parcubacteria group bacterium GW2011_GWC2_39_11]|nr:MAG: hypothetical protein UT22_C0009G0008 [Parcubacteria group bacterium GW2011_GWC2_39_11]
MAEVIKKDGTREPFDTGKIKSAILAAGQRTDLSEERKNEVAEQVVAAITAMADGKDEIASSEIKEKILSELDGNEPIISEEWRKYEQENK